MKTQRPFIAGLLPLTLLAFGTVACEKEGPGLSSDPPRVVTLVTDTGFTSPQDAVASADGSTFYFTAWTVPATGEEPEPALFTVAASGGTPTALHAGTPLVYPTGLVLGPDGQSLIVADQRTPIDEDAEIEEQEDISTRGALYRITVDGSTAIETVEASGHLAVPSGLALSVDGRTLFASGFNYAGTPGVFTLPVGGGLAEPLYTGEPLRSPTGIHVDAGDIAWVMDHIIEGSDGGGLYAITPAGEISTIIDGLRLGVPAGVSLTSGGGVAVIPNRDDEDQTRLTAVTIDTGTVEHIEAANIGDPAGLRTARGASVFAIVDHENNAIYRGE